MCPTASKFLGVANETKINNNLNCNTNNANFNVRNVNSGRIKNNNLFNSNGNENNR